MTICTHATLTVQNNPGEFYFEQGDAFEVCVDENGVLVLNFEGHDGGGIVFGPEDAKRLRILLNIHSPEQY